MAKKFFQKIKTTWQKGFWHKGAIIATLFFTLASFIAFLTLLGYWAFYVRRTSIEASSPTSNLDLDKEVFFEFSAPVSRKDVRVETSPKLPISFEWQEPTVGNRMYTKLVIKPLEPFYPETNYEIRVRDLKTIDRLKNLDITYLVETGSLPRVVEAEPETGYDQFLPDQSIKFSLDGKNTYTDFELISEPEAEFEIGKFSEDCVTFKPTEKLNQAQDYKFSLYRSFVLSPDEKEIVYEGEFRTVDPVTVVETSPPNDAGNVYTDTPIAIRFESSMDTESVESGFLIQPEVEGKFSWIEEDKVVTFTPVQNLEFKAEYTVKLGEETRTATGGVQNEPLEFKFTTIGEAQVVSYSPNNGQVSVSVGENIHVVFDQEVDHVSAESKFIIDPRPEGYFEWRGSEMTFHPNNGLQGGRDYTVTVQSGIKSIHGLDSVQIYSWTFKTTSKRTVCIGYSVQGRCISATYFGYGIKKVLFVGSQHGSEQNAGWLMNQWIDYLTTNEHEVPQDRTVIIVPIANPDGYAAKTRMNANGVDLNRNWQTANWQQETYMQSYVYPKGGGEFPFSEPETRALRDLVYREGVSIILDYHSQAFKVFPGGSDHPPSVDFARWYSQQTGYILDGLGPSVPCEDNNCGGVGYTVTGSFMDWGSEQGKTTICIELSSYYSTDWDRNSGAMREVLSY